MPQLMPLNWMMSSFMFLLILMFLMKMFFNMNDFINEEFFSVKMADKSWMW